MTELRTEQILLPSLEGLIHDRIDRQMMIVGASAAEMASLCYSDAALAGRPASAIYDTRSLNRLMSILAAEPGLPVCCPVTMLRADGTPVDFAAFVVPGREDDTTFLDVYKAETMDLNEEIRALGESNTVMWNIIQMAREAIWCIDYQVPVDVSGSEEEIIDGIFEQPSVWSLCNEAMAHAYDLPDAAHLSSSSVRFHWPRNPVNEAFIREIIANGFRVDGALSEDYRHDGSPVLVENDVRAHIVGGKLYRLWGTLREVLASGSEVATDRITSAATGFELLPVAAAVIAGDGSLLIANGLWQAAFAGSPDPVDRIVYRSLTDDRATMATGGLTASMLIMLRENAGGPAKPYSVRGRWHHGGPQGENLLIATISPIAEGDGR